jgi:hypothetical protein
MLVCQHGCDPARNPAWIVVHLDRGCVCFRTPGAQALCRQHYERLQPLGTITREVLV